MSKIFLILAFNFAIIFGIMIYKSDQQAVNAYSEYNTNVILNSEDHRFNVISVEHHVSRFEDFTYIVIVDRMTSFKYLIVKSSSGSITITKLEYKY